MKCWTAIGAFAVLAGCRAGDRTITHGVESRNEWTRRVGGAIPRGMASDSARALLEANGFTCEHAPEPRGTIWCEKWSGGRWAIVRRRWIASVAFDSGRVVGTRSNTGLVGP